MVALKYVVMLNGVTEIILTKADVLDEFETIQICTAYKINGKETTELPFDINTPIEPVYKELKGWNTQIKEMRKPEELPGAFNDYLKFIEDYINVPVSIVSVGPDRDATIYMK